MKSKNNIGIDNSGDWNLGNLNSGNGNSGNGNSGDWNLGNLNSGNLNSGNGNSGHWNSGDWNSGHWNSGDSNSGYGNSTDRESGIFCSKEGTVRMFNKQTNLKWDEIDHPHFHKFFLTEWIEESEMSNEEKKANPLFSVQGGYLKKLEYKEAWANFWRDTSEKNRKKFLALPNFDPVVFEEITGINVCQNSKKKELLDKADELIKQAQELREKAEEV